MVDVVEATEQALKAAAHLTDKDVGAVEALRALARKIDAWDQIVDYALEDLAADPDRGKRKGARPAVPQNDNVSISAYLKACDQLGLTPIGRKSLGMSEENPGGGVGGGSKLGKLRTIHGTKAAG